MMRRRCVYDVYALRLQFTDSHAALVHAGPAALCSKTPVNLKDLVVPRIFHTVNPVCAQQLQYQTVEILGACAYYDLFRPHSYAVKVSETACYSLPERHDAADRRVCEQLLLTVVQQLAHDSGPDGEGKLLRPGLIAGKVGYICRWRGRSSAVPGPRSGRLLTELFRCVDIRDEIAFFRN